jgi:hypothetical protein
MRQNNKKIMSKQYFFSISVVFVICVIAMILFRIGNYEVKKLDTNNDGKTDTIQYFKKGNKYKEAIDCFYDGKINVWRYWDKVGNIKRIVSIFDKHKSVTLFKKGQQVTKDGDILWIQEADLEKRYKKFDIDERNFIYTKDRDLLMIEIFNAEKLLLREIYYDYHRVSKVVVDHNQDGKFDEWQYYEYGKLTHIERDKDFDGEIDEVKNTQSEIIENK